MSNTFNVNNITDGQNINVEITLVSGCTISTATLTMIENEITDAGTISGTQQICYNNVPAQLTSVSTATVRHAASNLNYEWYSSTDNVTFNPTGIKALDFQPPALTQTSYFKRVVTSELNNEFCDADSNVLIVEVAPELIGGTILPLDDQYLCFDPLAPPILPPASLSVTNSVVDPLVTYQWQESTDTVSWTNVAGEVNQTFNPPVLTSSQTIYYRRMVRALGGGAGCEEFSTVHTLFVSDLDPGEIDTASNETYCFGTNPPIIGSTIDASSSSGLVSYQWESRTAGTAYAPIGGAILNSYDPGILTETTWFKRTVSSNISATTCELESNEVIIEILNEVNTGNILTSQVICENTIPNDLNLVGADAGGSVSYQWESSLDYLNWSEVTGEVGNTLSFSSVATQTTYYRVVITNATNSPTVLDPNQMQLSLTRIANPLKVGENYTVVVGTNTYSFTTTNIASDTNDIGNALANLIDATGGITSSYDNNTNSIAISPIVNNVSVFIQNPDNAPSHSIRILKSVTGEGCIGITDPVAIEVTPLPTLQQNGGPLNSQGPICPGDAIQPITFEWSGVSTVVIEDLNVAYTPSALFGGTVTTTGLPVGWYRVYDTNSFTITGTAGPTDFFTIRTEGSDCTEQFLDYSITVNPNAARPDVIMKDFNSIDYAVLYNPDNNKWHNNTVCQDRNDINGGGPTGSTDFYACFVDNSFNVLYNNFVWNIEPEAAGALVQDKFQQARILITSATATLTAGTDYTVSINGTSYTVSSSGAAYTTNDLGSDLAAAISANPAVNATFAAGRIVVTALVQDTPFTIQRNNPITAGDNAVLGDPEIDTANQKVTINWDQLFSGTVTLSVRTEGCGAPSDWYRVSIEVIPETVMPGVQASEILAPYDMSAINPNFGAILCDGDYTSVLPNCEITNNTRDTQFFSATVSGTNDHASLEWRISNPIPGNPLVPSPGIINASTGVVNWTTGWWGTFDIEVRPVSCSGTVTDTWIGTTFTIGPSEDDRPNILPQTDLPNCPIPAAGLQTTLRVPDFPVNWYINDLSAIQTGAPSNVVINNFRRQLQADGGTNDQELTLYWRPGYSGVTIIRAEPRDCGGSQRNYAIVVPGPADIRWIDPTDPNSPLATNGLPSQTVCQNENIDDITFELLGAATGVVSQASMNLPPGINANVVNFFQESEITLTDVTTITTSNRYTITIDGFDYDYRVQGGDDIDNIGNELSNSIPAAVMSTTYNAATNVLSFEGLIAGKYYVIVPNPPVNNGIDMSAPLSTNTLRRVTLTGAPDNSATTGTDYFYNITTSSESSTCTTDTFAGSAITVRNNPSITLVSGNISETVCDGSAINPIIFKIDDAPNIVLPIPGLPAGVNGQFAGGFLTISGIPNIGPAAPFTFTYSVTTINGACADTVEYGSIRVQPSPTVNIENILTENQTVCALEPITNIEYTVTNPAFGLEFIAGSTDLPDGVSGTLNVRNQVSEITFGGAAGVTGTLSIEINSGIPITFNAVATSTIDDAGTNLAADIDASPNYQATYAGGVIEITHNNSGVAFSTVVDDGGTNITMSSSIETTPAVFVISGTPSVTAGGLPKTYFYDLRATGPSCTDGSSIASGTILVNPNTSGTLDPAFGSDDQSVCDETAINTIQYNLVGAAAVAPDAGNPAWLNGNLDLAAQTFTIDATPIVGNLQEQTFEYSFTVLGNAFGCAASTSTLSGIITVIPAERLILTSGVASPSQEVCLENDIIDIVYEFSGSANAVAFSVAGLPTGVTGNYTPRQQVSVIQINNTGVTVVSETYVINVNSVPYNFNAPIGSDEDDIGSGIANQIDGDPDVSASFDNGTNRITITANVAGDSFGIYIPSSTNTIGFNRPTLATSQGVYVIRGRPTNNVSGTFNYTLTTPGIICDPDTQLGAIIVHPNSTIEIAAGTTDNQTICDGSVGDFVNMVYNIGGGARGIIASGLPQGIVPVLDNALNPTTVTLQGDPVTGDTGTNIYNFTLTTTANEEGCDEVSINGTITIEPNDTLTPSPTTAPAIIFNQEICIGESITPVVYEFSGGAIGASATGLPPGVNDSFVYRKQITSVRFTGPNINANEVYNVIIDNITHTTTSTAGQSPSDVVTDLIAIINAESTVATASNNGSILILTSVNDGQAFSVRTDKSAFAQLTIDPPVLENGTGILSITGTPTINAISAGQSSQSYTITVTTVNGNGCEIDIENPTIKVNSTSTISVTSLPSTLAQNLCLNVDIDPIQFTIGGGATFAIDDGGLPLGVGLNPLGGNNFEIVGKPVVAILVPTTYTFTVSTTGNAGGCDEVSFTGTIIISPDDEISLSSLATTTNQTICVGNDPSISQITTITYQLAGGATNASAAGLPAGIQTNYDPITRVFSIFGSSTETVTNTTTFNYTVTTSGTCINDSENGSIIIEPSATLSLTTVSSTLNQTLCDNTAINNIEFDLVGSAVGAQASGLPAGVDLNTIGLTAVISGSPATAVLTPTTYSFTITATTGSGCEVNSYSGEINVLPDDRLTLTSPATTTSQEICVSNDPILSRLTTITYELSGGATSANFVGLPPGFGTIYNPVSKVYSIYGSTTGSTVTQTTIYNYTVTTSGTCAAQTEVGDITIVPIASLDVTSVSSTLNQTICDGDNITPITFDFGGSATNASGLGLPLGVTLGPIVGNTITISGPANVNVVTPTTYTFTVTATGNGTCEEESFTGRIVVLPNDRLTHISGDKNPTICNGNDPSNPGITPIVYQLGGGATSGIVTGLPNGVSFTYSATTRQLTIDGRPSLAIAVPTPFNYTVTTIGSCASQTDSGIITVNPLSTISLSSAISTTSQIGSDGICMGDSIAEIFYTYGGGATSFSISGLPAGVQAQATGNPNEVRIFGEPNTGSTVMEIFTYTISTTGNPCAPETSLSGVIQVNPSPSVDSNFILNNDVTHVTCNGGSDGSIVIPEASPAFDLRIFGGQNSVRQVDRLSITGNFNPGDRVHVIINGNQYTHIVEETAFGSGIAEGNLSIASKLTDVINNAIPALAVPVTASAVAPGDVVLNADTAGVPFTVTFPVPPTQTLLNGDISNTNVVANLPLNYNYLWTYPDNSTNTNLSIYNLQAGDYTFEVTLNGCSSGVASFTIEEPDNYIL